MLKRCNKSILCHAFRLSPSNQASRLIFNNPISLNRREEMFSIISNKTGLQPVSRPVELVHYFGGWVEGPSKQTDRQE